MNYGARLAAAMDTSVRQMLNALSPLPSHPIRLFSSTTSSADPLQTKDFDIHPGITLYDETKSKKRPSTWPEYDDLLEEILASGKETERNRGISGNVPEVGVKLATATNPTFPSESLVGPAEDFEFADGNQSILNNLSSPARARAQSMPSAPECFETQETLPNNAHSFSSTTSAASRDSLPCDTVSCSEATLIPTTTTTKKREHDCEYEGALKKKQRTDLRSLTVEKPILPHPSSKLSKTTDLKRKLEDYDNPSRPTKKQRKNLDFSNTEKPFNHPSSSDTKKDINLQRKFEDGDAKGAGTKVHAEGPEPFPIEKPLSPPVSPQPATITPLKQKLNELTIEHESRKKQCTSFPNDPVQSSTIDGSGLVTATPEAKPSQQSSELTLPNISTAASSAGESPDHTVANGPISVANQSPIAEPYTLNVLDEQFITNVTPLGPLFETSSSPASLSTHITQATNYSPRPNTLDPNLKTNTPSTPVNQQTDAVTNIPGLGRLCEVQDRGTLLSLLDIGLCPEFHVAEEPAFSYPSPQANSSISESSNDWQSLSWCDFSTSSTVAKSPIFYPRPSFMNNWFDFRSSANPLQPTTQSYEYPISNPLVYGTSHNLVHQELEPIGHTDQASGFLAPSQNQDSEPFGTEYHRPAIPSLIPDDLSVIDPQLLAFDDSIGSPFSNPSLSSAPLLNEHPLFSSPQSPTRPNTQSNEHQNAPPDLPQFSRMFSPQSAIISEKSPLPYLLQRQVSPLPPLSSGTPQSPRDDSYDDDDFRISSAEPTARELKLRAETSPPPSKLRNWVTVITDAEKQFMAELELELEQELERKSDDESPVKISRKRRLSDAGDDDGERSAKRSRRC
ncbi:hypothetical protein DL95DRAFT_405728 [Leptodontidium sp. 2 PMI_412]|nr:hypothetical protein DL95DRAFT_405728 [Leptodontidium sp. 2 PMI_412]